MPGLFDLTDQVDKVVTKVTSIPPSEESFLSAALAKDAGARMERYVQRVVLQPAGRLIDHELTQVDDRIKELRSVVMWFGIAIIGLAIIGFLVGARIGKKRRLS